MEPRSQTLHPFIWSNLSHINLKFLGCEWRLYLASTVVGGSACFIKDNEEAIKSNFGIAVQDFHKWKIETGAGNLLTVVDELGNIRYEDGTYTLIPDYSIKTPINSPISCSCRKIIN